MQVLQWRPKARRLSDALSFHFLINDHIQLTKKGHLLATIGFTPSDTAGRVANQIITARNGLNSVIGSLGSKWAQWIENQRTELIEYDLADQYPDVVSELVDKTRKQTFTKPGTQFQNRHYYSVLYAPESDLAAKITSRFEQKSKDKSKKDEKSVRGAKQIAEQHINAFEDVISRLQLGLAGCMENARILRGDEISTYLRSCVSTKAHHVKMPSIPCLLDGWLPSQDYTSGYDPAFHDHNGTTYIKTITVRDTPEEIFPGILERLNKLPISYRHVVRMMTLDASEARKTLINRINALDASSSSISENIVARFTKEKPSVAPDMQVKIDHATQAVAELGHGIIVWGYYTHSIVLWDKDKYLLAEAVRYVEAEFTARGFITEVPRAQTSAWIGTIPGHPHGNLTRLLKCSLNVCDLAPVQGVWEGPKRDEHLNGPALLRGTDTDKTAFYLSLHQPGADVGHVAVLGEIGSGKTSLLSSMVIAHSKYQRSRIRIFDRGSTMKNSCLLLGGTSYGLGSYDDNVSLQPLAFVDNPQEAMWAFGYICGLLERNRVEIDGIVQGDVTNAIADLSHMDPRHRTMTQLMAQCQQPQVKKGLEVFCKGGALGDLLDNDSYRLGTADIAHFEIDKLVNSEGGMALSAVIPCIFRDIERNYDGAPTLIVIDEAKQFITHKLIAERLDELYRRSRKEKIHIVLATHTINDIYGSGVKDILEQSCKSYIFAANPSATEDRPFQAMLELGLTSEQIRMISRLQPKREYIFKTQGVWRRFRLELSKLELSLIGRASDSDRKMMDVLYARHGPEEYRWAWLRYCGHSESEIRDWKRMVGLVPEEEISYGVAAE